MKFDVSELKTFKDCGRKWELSSRNAYHLRPKMASPNLIFGTIFHECLHALYAGTLKPEGPNVDLIIEQAQKEMEGDTVAQKVIKKMVEGYYEGPYADDIAMYKVLDIERRFEFPIPALGNDSNGDPVLACGSIDMITLMLGTNQIWGFEHKSCKNFRTNVYHMLDEQPKMYFMALQQIVDDYNAEHGTDYVVGGLIVNEVKKMSTKFEYSRRECIYTPEQQNRFYKELLNYGSQILYHKERLEASTGNGDASLPPQASYLKCAMCDYAPVCEQYGDAPVDLELLLDEFQEEFQVREVDHLEEKMERKFDDE